MNVCEQLISARNWLNMQRDELTEGLKSATDAVKLYEYWLHAEELPEYCDDPEGSAQQVRFDIIFKKVLGYNPFERARELERLVQIALPKY